MDRGSSNKFTSEAGDLSGAHNCACLVPIPENRSVSQLTFVELDLTSKVWVFTAFIIKTVDDQVDFYAIFFLC